MLTMEPNVSRSVNQKEFAVHCFRGDASSVSTQMSFVCGLADLFNKGSLLSSGL